MCVQVLDDPASLAQAVLGLRVPVADAGGQGGTWSARPLAAAQVRAMVQAAWLQAHLGAHMCAALGCAPQHLQRCMAQS